MAKQNKYRYKGYSHKRDSTGTITTIIQVETATSDATLLKYEFPYSSHYETIQKDTMLSYEQTRDGQVSIQFPPENQSMINAEQKCPFCGATLINLKRNNISDKHCFNVGCYHSLYAKISDIYYSASDSDLNDTLVTKRGSSTTSDINLLYDLISARSVIGNAHILTLLMILNNAHMEREDKLYEKLLHRLSAFVKTCTISSFLEMLNIPSEYYDHIQQFDNDYESIEAFYTAMQNHRSLQQMYDQDLLNLIYICFHINDKFINDFMIVRRTNQYV